MNPHLQIAITVFFGTYLKSTFACYCCICRNGFCFKSIIIKHLLKFFFFVSVKVYKGLDIITNKVTVEEKQNVPHHLIDIFDSAQEFTVIDFKKQALDTIGDLTKRNKIPIIVGGTNYFIEALLWNFLIEGG